MSYFIYTDFISSLLDPRFVDPGSSLIYIGAYGPKALKRMVIIKNRNIWWWR